MHDFNLKVKLGYFLFCILLLPTLPLFPGNKLPPWVKNRGSAEYSESRYLQAVGQNEFTKKKDEARNLAIADAHNQIARQLSVQISSKFTVLKFEDKARDIYQEQTSDEILAATNITLTGLRLAREHKDKKNKTYYVLAILDRRKAARAMFGEIRTLKTGAGNAFKTANNLVGRHNPLPAIINNKRAFQLLHAAEERERILNVLNPANLAPDEQSNSPDVEQILELLQQSARDIRLELQVGTSTIQSRHALPFICETKVVFRDKPVANLPLSYIFNQGRGRAHFPGRTDEEGKTQFVINELGPAPNGEYMIEVSPNLSDFLINEEQINAQTWNNALRQTLRPATITLKRLDLDLADYCAGVASDLERPLNRTGAPFQLAMGNITYAETGASSPLVAYLKDKISAELSHRQGIQIISPERIQQSLLASKGNYSGLKRPDRPEILAELMDANGLLVGTYWQHSDRLEFNLQIVQRNSAATLSTAVMKLPKSLIPPHLPYLPANLSAFTAAKQLGDVQRTGNNLQVEVWVDRGDGAIYRAGDKLTLFVRASLHCYLYLIYHDAGGNDILIFPNARQANNRILGGVIYQVPDARDSFDFTIQAPFGSELLKAVVAKESLPELHGRVLANGLKLLSGSYKENLVRLRGITMQSRASGYAEGSCVVTTVE